MDNELIVKLEEYKNKRLESLDWPYHSLLIQICSDISEIIEECE